MERRRVKEWENITDFDKLAVEDLDEWPALQRLVALKKQGKLNKLEKVAALTALMKVTELAEFVELDKVAGLAEVAIVAVMKELENVDGLENVAIVEKFGMAAEAAVVDKLTELAELERQSHSEDHGE